MVDSCGYPCTHMHTQTRNFGGQRCKNHYHVERRPSWAPHKMLTDLFSLSLFFFCLLSLVCLRNTFPNSSSDKHILTALLWNHGKGPILSPQTHMCIDTHVRRTLNGLSEECAAKGSQVAQVRTVRWGRRNQDQFDTKLSLTEAILDYKVKYEIKIVSLKHLNPSKPLRE